MKLLIIFGDVTSVNSNKYLLKISNLENIQTYEFTFRRPLHKIEVFMINIAFIGIDLF